MNLSPDQHILWQYGVLHLNETILTTWGLMLAMVLLAKFCTRRLSRAAQTSRWQSMLEIIVINIKQQIEEIGLTPAEKYLGFIGTLFLFIASANLCTRSEEHTSELQSQR